MGPREKPTGTYEAAAAGLAVTVMVRTATRPSTASTPSPPTVDAWFRPSVELESIPDRYNASVL